MRVLRFLHGTITTTNITITSVRPSAVIVSIHALSFFVVFHLFSHGPACLSSWCTLCLIALLYLLHFAAAVAERD